MEVGIAAAGLGQEGGPLVGAMLQSGQEDRSGLFFDRGHETPCDYSPLLNSATQPGIFSHHLQRILVCYESFNNSPLSHARP